MRRLGAVFIAGLLIATGCVANSYQIPRGDLQRLSAAPPEARGARVRVIQEVGGTDVPTAQRVDANAQVVLVPDFTLTHDRSRYSGGGYGGGVRYGGGGVRYGGGSRYGGRSRFGGRSSGGGLKIGGGGGSGSDAAAVAVVFLAVAAVALVAVAGVEASRFDGWAELHPMHPVHLIGKDGGYTVLPLAWIDPGTAAWADKAIVRPSEGPWRQRERHPLHRTGPTYGMYGGVGSLRSSYGELGVGPAFTVQAGYFPAQQVGVVGSIFVGWRENRALETLLESRYTLELQVMPVAAGAFHAGFYAGAGAAYRFEDGADGSAGSTALTGGAMLQLDVNTRIALTARFGLAKAHEEQMKDVLFGISVY